MMMMMMMMMMIMMMMAYKVCPFYYIIITAAHIYLFDSRSTGLRRVMLRPYDYGQFER